MAAKNIWIDDAFPYSGQTLHYCVKRNGTKIYEGEATARDFPIVIYLNRIAQDYLESTFPTETGVTADPGAGAAFSLVEMTRNGSEWVDSSILYCAVYIDAWGGENGQEMAQPINGHADMRQRLLYTSFGEIEGCGTIDSGTTENTYITTKDYSGGTITRATYSSFLWAGSSYEANHIAEGIVEGLKAQKDEISGITEDGMRVIYPYTTTSNISVTNGPSGSDPNLHYLATYRVTFLFSEPVRLYDGNDAPFSEFTSVE